MLAYVQPALTEIFNKYGIPQIESQRCCEHKSKRSQERIS